MGERTPPPFVWDQILPLVCAPNALGLEIGSKWSLTPVLPSLICFKATGEVSCIIFLLSSIFFYKNEWVSLVYVLSFIFYPK